LSIGYTHYARSRAALQVGDDLEGGPVVPASTRGECHLERFLRCSTLQWSLFETGEAEFRARKWLAAGEARNAAAASMAGVDAVSSGPVSAAGAVCEGLAEQTAIGSPKTLRCGATFLIGHWGHP
jgi:hypothetical protein